MKERIGTMRGRMISLIWPHDPTRDAPPRHRRACEYEAFVPNAVSGLRIDLPGPVTGVVSEAEKAVADLNAGAGPELAPLARLLLRTESIASSKVEGLQVGTRNLARAEANESTGRKVSSEAAEILGNIDAMQFAIEEAAAAAPSRGTFTEIHRELMTRAPNSAIAGRVRERQNWIGGNDYTPCDAAFVPPPHEEVDPLLDDLAHFIEEDSFPPLVQAAIAHAQFETIHPFEDGNGRTGRALIHVILRRRGLTPSFVPPISVVFARTKDSYIRGLTLFREDDLAAWIESFAACALGAATLADRYVGRVRALQDEWRERLQRSVDPRSDAAAWAIIDVLPAHPVITVPAGVVATGRTKPAVTNSIDQLVRARVLEPLGDSKRNRAWEAIGLLDLIEELEAGGP
jgi:Fic family protein